MRYFLFDHSTQKVIAVLHGTELTVSGEIHQMLGCNDQQLLELLQRITSVINFGSSPANEQFPFILKESTVRNWVTTQADFVGTAYYDNTLHSVWSKD
jgi:hypothetical protein